MIAPVRTCIRVTIAMYHGCMSLKATRPKGWRTTHGDMTDEEWALIADLVEPSFQPGEDGPAGENDRRAVVDAIFYVAATGCQWRALPGK